MSSGRLTEKVGRKRSRGGGEREREERYLKAGWREGKVLQVEGTAWTKA